MIDHDAIPARCARCRAPNATVIMRTEIDGRDVYGYGEPSWIWIDAGTGESVGIYPPVYPEGYHAEPRVRMEDMTTAVVFLDRVRNLCSYCQAREGSA